jgi:hypothetical protein
VPAAPLAGSVMAIASLSMAPHPGSYPIDSHCFII